jgi:two-component system, LytTR family, response regulator
MPSNNFIAIQMPYGRQNFDKQCIVHCQAFSNYTRIFFSNKNSVLIAKTLGQLEKYLFCKDFIRVHQSHLVNTTFIKSVQKQQLELVDGAIIKISRRLKKNLTKTFN